MAINVSHASDSLTPTTGSLTITANTLYANNSLVVTANSFINYLGAPGTSGNVLTSNGTSWISSAPSGAGTITTTDFTATAGQTTFSANYTVGLVNVYRNGVKLGKADFTATSGTSIVLAVGANVGDLVQIEAFSSLNIYSTVTSDTFSGNGSTTTFTMSVTPFNAASVLVVISGVTQAPSTYSVSGTTLTFTTAPPAGSSNISVRYLALPATGAVTGINFGSTGLTPAAVTSGNVTVSGTLNVSNGGTGATSLAANNVILGNGTSAVQVVAPGASGNVLTSNGTSWISSGTTSNVAFTNWTITQSGTKLYFAYNGVNKFSFDSSGTIIAANNVTAAGTP